MLGFSADLGGQILPFPGVEVKVISAENHVFIMQTGYMNKLILLGSMMFCSLTVVSAQQSGSTGEVKPDPIAWLLSVYEPVEGKPSDGEVSNERRMFMQTRLANAPGDFDKWRSFPPSYYSVMKEFTGKLPESFSTRLGTVMGDPHVENFGYIALDPARFGGNDLDDVTLGSSLDSDLMRLFIGHQFVDPTLTATEFLNAYKNGLNNENLAPEPAYIKGLSEDASDPAKRHSLSKKNRAIAEAKACSGEYEMVSEEERERILEAYETGSTCKVNTPLTASVTNSTKAVLNANQPRVHLICRRKKESGGSAGASRFLVIVEKGDLGSKNYEGFEYKQLSPMSPRFEPIENNKRQAIFEEAVVTALGKDAAKEYYPKQFRNGVLYQRRPAWKGNQGVKIADIPAAEKKSVLLYEAQTLGQLHRRSNPSKFAISDETWSDLAKQIKSAWKSKFE